MPLHELPAGNLSIQGAPRYWWALPWLWGPARGAQRTCELMLCRRAAERAGTPRAKLSLCITVHQLDSGHASSSRVPTSPSRGFDQPERVSVRSADARRPCPAPPLRSAGYRLPYCPLRVRATVPRLSRWRVRHQCWYVAWTGGHRQGIGPKHEQTRHGKLEPWASLDRKGMEVDRAGA